MKRNQNNGLEGATALSRRDMIKTSAAVSAASLFAALGSNFAYAQGSDQIRVGQIGCGGRGTGAVQDAVKSSKDVKVIALADLFPDQLENTKKTFAAKPKEQYDIKDDHCFVGWDAYKKLLETDVNYVVLATPPGFRPMMIEAAIAAGKHVFAEKPVAVDPAGVRRVLAAAEIAKEKKLGFVCGTQRRHQTSYIETIKRIHDGAIGDLIAGQCYWMQNTLWNKARQPNWSDTEWQIRNWLYFTWLSGDHIVEQHLHQHDVMNWVFGGPPLRAQGVGGRMVRTDPAYGHIYDFFSIEYDYKTPTGVAKVQSMCRQMDNTMARISENVQGTKGSAIVQSRIEGENKWRYEPPEDENVETNPYVLEHRDLIASIRKGEPLNEGKQSAESALTSIMGRMAAYTGKLVTWQQAMNSKLDLFPKKLEFGPMPVPPVALPGKEELI